MNTCIPIFSLVLSSLFSRFKVLAEEKREGDKGQEEGGRERGPTGGSLSLVMCLSLRRRG